MLLGVNAILERMPGSVSNQFLQLIAIISQLLFRNWKTVKRSQIRHSKQVQPFCKNFKKVSNSAVNGGIVIIVINFG